MRYSKGLIRKRLSKFCDRVAQLQQRLVPAKPVPGKEEEPFSDEFVIYTRSFDDVRDEIQVMNCR